MNSFIAPRMSGFFVANLRNSWAITCDLRLKSKHSESAQESAPNYTDFDNMTPDATIEIRAKSFKLLLGGAWGEGVLHYQGKAYPFKAKAGSVGGVGYKSVDATGEVFRLESLDDFAGFYTGGALGATAGSKGSTGVALENGKKVVIRLDAAGKGLQLSASLGSLNISWKE